jgi:hypothetical protein
MTSSPFALGGPRQNHEPPFPGLGPRSITTSGYLVGARVDDEVGISETLDDGQRAAVEVNDHVKEDRPDRSLASGHGGPMPC